MRTHSALLAALLCGLSLSLAACDDGGGSSSPPPDSAVTPDPDSEVTPDPDGEVTPDPDGEVPCETGATGCACFPNDTCLDGSDECVGGLCAPRAGCDGELGCACREGDACDEGLTCGDGLCRAPSGLLLKLEGGDARACDLIITTQGRWTQDVIFPAGVKGRMKTRDARTAVALIRAEDSALSGAIATLVLAGGDLATPDLIESITATCYDRLGQPDAAPTVSVE